MWVRSWCINIGTFIHQQINTFGLRNFSKPREIELSINWIVFETPVTHMNNVPIWCTNNHRYTSWNRVQNMHKFKCHIFRNSNLLMLEWINNLIIWRNFNNRLFHLAFNHSNREIGCINWNIISKFRQKLANSANMIKVSMCKCNSLNFMHIIF